MPVRTCVAECAWNGGYICHWGHPFFFFFFWGCTFGRVYTPCILLACQVELPQAIQVFVVVSLVCRALLFPYVRWFTKKRVAILQTWKNKRRDKSLCGICGQKMKDGNHATEFKVSWAYQIGDMGFHGQMTIKCNTKVLDRVRQGNRCTTYSYKVWEGKRERPRLSTRRYDHCFSLVVI